MELSFLQEVGLHGSGLNLSSKSATLEGELTSLSNIVLVVCQVSSRLGHVCTSQLHVQCVCVVCRVDDRNGNGAVLVLPCSDIDLFNTGVGKQTHSTRACETEVTSKCPKTSGDLVRGTVYLNEGGICGSCPTAPPMAPTCDIVAECIVHVNLENRSKISTILGWKTT